jgi:RNA polymerase sigma factor for flagellar operon FliA
MRSSITQSTRSDILVEYLPMVKAAAARVRQHLPGEPEFDELVAVGVLALADAAKHSRPTKSIRFVTYAKKQIRGAMLDRMKKQASPRRFRSPKPETAPLEPASASERSPHEAKPAEATPAEEFGAALVCLQRALAAHAGSDHPSPTSESATEVHQPRWNEDGER